MKGIGIERIVLDPLACIDVDHTIRRKEGANVCEIPRPPGRVIEQLAMSATHGHFDDGNGKSRIASLAKELANRWGQWEIHRRFTLAAEVGGVVRLQERKIGSTAKTVGALRGHTLLGHGSAENFDFGPNCATVGKHREEMHGTELEVVVKGE